MLWLALGWATFSVPLLPTDHRCHHHSTRLKANSTFAATWLLRRARGHALGAISNLYQDQPRKGNDSRAIANPKGPLWPKAPSWWNTVIAWTIFSHSVLQLTTGNEERFYTSQQKQVRRSKGLKRSFQPECLAKPTKLLCAVWKHFTLEIFIYTFSKRACAPSSHPST